MKNPLAREILSRIGFLALLLLWFIPSNAGAARLNMSPTSGSFPVGSTFTVKIGIDTEGEDINALDLNIDFPADKIQLVSANTAISLIDVWASQPKFNNRTGSLVFQGGIPNGITTSNGLISELTFRVRSTGQALIKFSSDSSVYLNDGKATLARSDYQNSLVRLTLPPPEGPTVVSNVHQQGVWSSLSDVIFSWTGTSDGYSFVLDNNPVSEPDEVIDSSSNSTSYKKVDNGISFFHIKAFHNGVWGGTSHYEINVDDQIPADFKIEIFPSAHTSVSQPTVSFSSSDAHSGVSHYEVNVIPLFSDDKNGEGYQYSFVEASSPYLSHELEPGPYEVVVRVYDNAGNVFETTKKLRIVKGFISFASSEGIIVRDVITVSWVWVFVILTLFVLAILREIYIAKHLEEKYKKKIKLFGNQDKVPDEIAEQLGELKKYRKKYGKITALILLIGGSLLSAGNISAQESVASTPVISGWSEYVTNDEIFYVHGQVDDFVTGVELFLQDLVDGSVVTYDINVDKKGNWFYRHGDFLRPGEYGIWVQSKSGNQKSPPSAQRTVTVARSALSFGSTQISLGFLYLVIVILLTLLLIGLISYVLRIRSRATNAKDRYLKEVREAESSVKRGFALLRKDLEREVDELQNKLKGGHITSEDLLEREQELLEDMRLIEEKIGKEVWDIEAEIKKS